MVVDHDDHIRHDESQPANDESMLGPIATTDGCASDCDASSIAKHGLDGDVSSVHSDDVEVVLQEQQGDPSGDESPDASEVAPPPTDRAHIEQESALVNVEFSVLAAGSRRNGKAEIGWTSMVWE